MALDGKLILAYAAEDANRMDDFWIDTDDLALGILRDRECSAAARLEASGLEIEGARAQVSSPAPERQKLRADFGPVDAVETDNTPRTDYCSDLSAADGSVAQIICERSSSQGMQPYMIRSSRDRWIYVLGALCGIGIGWADLVVNDLLFTALLVLAACIVLGLLQPRWPWRWVVTVGILVPFTELVAYAIQAGNPTRAQVYGSFLAFLPGIAGAYGGSIMRGVIENLMQGKQD